jgi:hypothetical protein
MKKLSLLVTPSIIICLVFTVSCVSKEVPVTETYYETEYKTEYKTENYTAIEDVVVKTAEDSESVGIKSQWKTSLVYLSESGSDLICYYGYDIRAQEHSRSHIQISFNLQPQLHKGIIYVIDLTGDCYDQNIQYPDVLFGYLFMEQLTDIEERQISQPSLKGPPTGGGIMPGLENEYKHQWLDGFYALAKNPKRLLAELSVDKATANDQITFDAKDIKAFAIVIATNPEIKQPSVKLTWSDDIIEKQTVTKEKQVPYQVPVQVEKQRTIMQTKKVPFWEAIFH